jgi:hypothetical protein
MDFILKFKLGIIFVLNAAQYFPQRFELVVVFLIFNFCRFFSWSSLTSAAPQSDPLSRKRKVLFPNHFFRLHVIKTERERDGISFYE